MSGLIWWRTRFIRIPFSFIFKRQMASGFNSPLQLNVTTGRSNGKGFDRLEGVEIYSSPFFFSFGVRFENDSIGKRSWFHPINRAKSTKINAGQWSGSNEPERTREWTKKNKKRERERERSFQVWLAGDFRVRRCEDDAAVRLVDERRPMASRAFIKQQQNPPKKNKRARAAHLLAAAAQLAAIHHRKKKGTK